MSDEDPIVAYLAGDTSVSLDPAESAEMEKIRIALADGATWVEPDASLQQRIIEAVRTRCLNAVARRRDLDTTQPAGNRNAHCSPQITADALQHPWHRCGGRSRSRPRGRLGRGFFRPRQPNRGLLGVPYRDTAGTECLRNSSAHPNPERLADSRQSDGASAPGQR